MNWHEKLRYRIFIAYFDCKKFLFGFYHIRLAYQARYLYRQSELFRLRRDAMGLEFADTSFKYDQIHFWHKAQKEPLQIRLRLFLDGLQGKELMAYYICEDE